MWFHEVFRGDGTPYRPDEVDLLKRLTSRAPQGRVSGAGVTAGRRAARPPA